MAGTPPDSPSRDLQDINDAESLCTAVLQGRIAEALDYIIIQDSVEQVIHQRNDGRTLLHAIVNGVGCNKVNVQSAIEFVTTVINPPYNLPLDTTCHGQETIIHYAAQFESAEIAPLVQSLLDNGAPLDLEDSVGFTPLLHACENENLALVKILHERGANIEHVSSITGENALMAVVGGNHDTTELLEWLLQLPNCPDTGNIRNDHRTALLIAAANGNHQAIQMLLNHGADLSPIDDRGNNPLHLAAFNYPDGDEFCNDYEQTLCVLLERIKQLPDHLAQFVNAQNQAGGTPVYYAANNWYAETCQLLLAAGADPKIASGTGETALSCATELATHPEYQDDSLLALMAPEEAQSRRMEHIQEQAQRVHGDTQRQLARAQQLQQLITQTNDPQCKAQLTALLAESQSLVSRAAALLPLQQQPTAAPVQSPTQAQLLSQQSVLFNKPTEQTPVTAGPVPLRQPQPQRRARPNLLGKRGRDLSEDVTSEYSPPVKIQLRMASGNVPIPIRKPEAPPARPSAPAPSDSPTARPTWM